MQNYLVGSLPVLSMLLAVLVLSVPGPLPGGEAYATENPSVRQMPGLNARDPFPRGCVDCHVYLPAEKRDVRLSTLLKNLTEKAEPELLARLAKLAPEGRPLQGRHPELSNSKLNIPADCVSCHGENATDAPPFAGMMHLIHLAGGEDNHYLAIFQGECGFCHKFDANVGTWAVPSHPE